MLHVAAWAEIALARLDGEPAGSPPPEVDWPAVPGTADDDAWAAARRRLVAAYETLAARVASLPAERLLDPVPGREHTVGVMLDGVVEHGTYHGGQLALLRRALGERSLAPPSWPLRGDALSVSLTVSDLPRSRAWYSDVMGFVVEREHERGGAVRAISLRAGAVRLLIGQDDGAKGLDREKGEGLSLMITTDQPIDGLAEAIRGNGGRLDGEPASTPWGGRVFRLRDPDGFRWTIASPAPGRQ